MKFAKKLTATIAVCASVTFAGAGVSSAKVFLVIGLVVVLKRRITGLVGGRLLVTLQLMSV